MCKYTVAHFIPALILYFVFTNAYFIGTKVQHCFRECVIFCRELLMQK